ncbi:Hpt domain-containing protein [Aureispira anguillae]|uniref:Hpt domain-containing protein n=1 Tax=Aureispira anguillae TaxID=2864201 RepID=A0A915YM30_9BACT|nr:Hpt domain-containing protein [Aureispira anguillae]BDS15600.1 Hpt domain-containing protein [Aureispira anguillae]
MKLTLDLTFLNEISGGDQEFIHDVLSTFLEEMPKDIDQMNQAIQEQNNIMIGRVAHKTKSSLQTLGLYDLKDIAVKIEQAIKTEPKHSEAAVWAKEFVLYMNQVYPNVKALLK